MTESSGACEGIGNETTMKTGNSDGQFRGNSPQFLSARFLILPGGGNTERPISDKHKGDAWRCVDECVASASCAAELIEREKEKRRNKKGEAKQWEERSEHAAHNGVITNPPRERVAVYVLLYMYKIARVTRERETAKRGMDRVAERAGGCGTAGTMRASSRKERKSSEKAE